MFPLFAFLLAQTEAPTPENIGAFAQAVLDAVMGGKWAVLVGLVLVAIVWGLRKFVVPKAPFFATDEGAFSVNLVASFALALATALAAGGFAAVTWPVVLKALEVAFLAAGGFAAVTKFLVPLLMRIPFVASFFSRGSATEAVTAAQKQGLAAAVVAKTPTSDEIANR
jgi:hypothetical protein